MEEISNGLKMHIERIFRVHDFKFPMVEFTTAKLEIKDYGTITSDEMNVKLMDIRDKYRKMFPDDLDLIYRLTNEESSFALVPYVLKQIEIPNNLTPLIREVKRTLSSQWIEMPISHKYDVDKNVVTIYSKFFDTVDEEKRNIWIRRCIASGVFYAIYNFLSPNAYRDNSFYAEVVKDSLADYYSCLFCIDKESAITDEVSFENCKYEANRRYNFWREYIFIDIPFVNAIFHGYKYSTKSIGDFVQCMGDTSINKFHSIFEISKKSTEDAYFELVPKEFRKKNSSLHYVSLSDRQTQVSDSYSNNIFPKVQGSSSTILVDNFNLDIWKIITHIIKEKEISTIEELQYCIPTDIFQVMRGRFITLESGEIISAYPQWRIVDYSKFEKFVQDTLGCNCCHFYVVIDVSFGDRKTYKYLLDPKSPKNVIIGDSVTCTNRNGGSSIGTVVSIEAMTDEQYREFCDKINYAKLSIAKLTEEN